ncbi:excalibur calcium-binding protein [Streptomyces sp. NPDC058700]|uniref:excalibur calcium-binding protein n=1 Tax=unclassified Streptomyces TaxID=2593676 RepID=UPI00364D5860
MSSRSVVVGIALAIASVAPVSGVAHAQDLDCRHFRYQEDAQEEFDRDTRDPNRLDEDQGPDDGIACEALPRRSGMGAVPPVSPSATSMPPVRPSAPTVSPPLPSAPTAAPLLPNVPTVPPVSPRSTAVQPADPGAAPSQPTAPVVPSRGTRAGIGGASGPSGLSVGIGLALAVGATVAGGYLTARRLRRGSKQP